jgi:hypothetical protein
MFLPMFPVRPYPGAINVSGASITGSITAVTFHTDIRPPDRGEHQSSQQQAQILAQAPYPTTPQLHDAVQVGTETGLVLLLLGVTGWTLVAFWVNGRWVPSFRSGSSA